MKSKLSWHLMLFFAYFSPLANAQTLEGKPDPAQSEEQHDHDQETLNASPIQPSIEESNVAPVFIIAKGLNADGSLIVNYTRGLRYAIDYFGNFRSYYIYLLSPNSEQDIRDIFRKRAEFRVNPDASATAEDQIEEFLKRPNVTAEIEAVLSGKSHGGLTWTPDPPRVFEDVTTNATQRDQNPIKNTWVCRWRNSTRNSIHSFANRTRKSWRSSKSLNSDSSNERST